MRGRRDPKMHTASQVEAASVLHKQALRNAARRAGHTSVNAFLLEQERAAFAEHSKDPRADQRAVRNVLRHAVAKYSQYRRQKHGL